MLDVLLSRPNFFLRFRRTVDLLSYDSKTTDKRGQYVWRAKKKMDGMFIIRPVLTGINRLKLEANGIARSFFRNCQIRPGNKKTHCQIDLSISVFFLLTVQLVRHSKDVGSRKRFSKA